MAPEQAQGRQREVGPASDVYSIGALLYHLLTGRPPFQAATLTEVLQQVVTTEPVAPRLLNPNVPRDLETICLKCLEKEVQRRYPTAQELADDLGRFLQDLGRARELLDRHRPQRQSEISNLKSGLTCAAGSGAISGVAARATSASPFAATRTRCRRWRSRPTPRPWPPWTTMEPSASGTSNRNTSCPSSSRRQSMSCPTDRPPPQSGPRSRQQTPSSDGEKPRGSKSGPLPPETQSSPTTTAVCSSRPMDGGSPSGRPSRKSDSWTGPPAGSG